MKLKYVSSIATSRDSTLDFSVKDMQRSSSNNRHDYFIELYMYQIAASKCPGQVSGPEFAKIPKSKYSLRQPNCSD